MSLMPLSHLLADAQSRQYAIGYFEAWDCYSFEAVLEAAEEEQAPVTLGFGGTMMNQSWLSRFGIEPLGAYGRVIAEKATVPTALILNEVLELAHVRQGVTAGFNTVMLDSCQLPFDENVAITKQVVACARPHSIEVQAEFGRLPNFGESAEGTLTDPGDAARFVGLTGVDFLAVSIGNVHLQAEGSSSIDIERLQEIRQAVSIPLVIHGGTGFPDDELAAVIESGVSLFHFGTLMKKRFLEEAKAGLADASIQQADFQALVGSRKASDFLQAGKEAIKDTVRQQIRCYGSSGKALDLV